VSLRSSFKILDKAALGIILVAFSGAACTSKGTEFRQAVDRNVLLITIDTLRGDALGCDGGPARTPYIDALAAGGVRFSFAHAQAVVTLPSHASILTGLYPFQHGYRENSGYRLTSGVQTLASRLKANGFSTGAFVGAFPLDARFGLTPGFDTYDGRFDDVGSGAEFLLPERPAPVVVDRAVKWIQQRDGRWFAWVHVYDPHAPYRPPPPFDREYATQPYYGEVAATDQALGPLLAAARASSRSTLVVLTGDHGESLGEHGELTHGLFAYEPTLRVPLIMAEIAGSGGSGLSTEARAESSRAKVDVSDQPARHVDIVPTILDALAMPVPPDLPGHTLRTRADRDAGAARPSYFEAMESTLDFGFAPLDGVLVGREKIYPSADPRALRPGRRSRRDPQPRRPRGRARTGARRPADRVSPHPARRAAARVAGGHRSAPLPRLRVGVGGAEVALRRGRRSQAAGRDRSADARGGRARRRGKAGRRDRALPANPRGASGDDGGVAPSRVRSVARRRSGGRHRRASRRGGDESAERGRADSARHLPQ